MLSEIPNKSLPEIGKIAGLKNPQSLHPVDTQASVNARNVECRYKTLHS
ncbi:hypothetical protein [Umezakia ovalisporum]|uniref:Uncharacterized protein n=1 Tax=Umezakia ovalisporum FSS-43 TaxID=2740520 RepID=A0ABT6K5N3_9CYAN|nr:hypothetical protein [Umezakia ovalisporum]MDH6057688.1 hypothetical protein [Umezakia ovalisporum FSS-43]MDH6067827.1 hypothetical protein [Umezakia ovalisporum APH033B]MDH6072265.1 hypothetical protein [Umezakia ovalisporum CobakiLakeA]MDH6074478.1 hypothetical protein [Umezakia ovalisporum CS-1034]MDH6077912.1 hypothetical protein [Umezakia ovalisporum FSS-45]